MREEFERLLAAYSEGKDLYLVGPLGSGKTFLTRDFPLVLLQKRVAIPGIFVCVARSCFDWRTGDWAVASRSIGIACYIPTKDDPAHGIDWLAPADAIQKYRLPMPKGLPDSSLATPESWPDLARALSARFARVVFVLDDYDHWPVSDQVAAHEQMLRCPDPRKGDADDPKVIFWPTGETSLDRLRAAVRDNTAYAREAKVVRGVIDPIRCRRLSDSTVSEMVTKQLSGELAGVLADDESVQKILDVTGGFPKLVQTLVEQISKFTKRIRTWENGIADAEASQIFQDDLRTLYRHLPDDSHRSALALVAISQLRNRPLSETLSDWRSGFPMGAFSQERLDELLRDLVNQLLVLREGNTYRIASSALLTWITTQTLTMGIQAQMGIAMITPDIGGWQRGFLGAVSLGIVLYILGRYLPISFLRSLPPEWQAGILVAAFVLPAIIVLVSWVIGSRGKSK